jgi:hypothetical protein
MGTNTSLCHDRLLEDFLSHHCTPMYRRTCDHQSLSFFWFTHAFSSAIAQAFVTLADDPLLVWLYVSITILTFLGWIGFSWTFRSLDKENDALEKLPEGRFQSFLRTRICKNCCNRESLIQLVCGESLSSQISSMVAQPSAVLN